MRGIYKLTNTINEKVYIGKSENLGKRIKYHISSLTHGKNKNKHLQNAYSKYGSGNFSVEIIEVLDNDADINEREKYWISYYKANNRNYGYNLTNGGDGGNGYFDCMTEDEKNKHLQVLSEAHKGENNPLYGKHCYTDGSILKYFTEEEAKPYIEQGWHKGIPQRIRENERNGNMGENNGFYGKKHTEETRQKISASRKENKNWNYGLVIYHRGDEQKYILPSEIDQYEKDGWIKGLPPYVVEKVKKSKIGKKLNVNKINSIIYIYGSQQFYGWRKLQAHLRQNGYPKISEAAIVKLSKGKSVRGYDDLFGTITVLDGKENANE